MIPIIFVTKEKKNVVKFINNQALENNISPWAIMLVEKEATSVTIDQIRNIISNTGYNNSIKQLVAIYDFDSCRPEAQNAFLKTLEEKSASIMFILVVSEETSLLATIRSRCRIVKESGVSRKDEEKNRFSINELGDLLVRFSGYEKKRDEVINIIDNLLLFYRKKLLMQENVVDLIRIILQSRKDIKYYNANPQLVLDCILLKVNK